MIDFETLKRRLSLEPFQPFTIELASGRQILVDQDSELFFPRLHPERVIAFTKDGLQHEFDDESIISLVEPR